MPFLLFVSVIEWALWNTGETWPVGRAIEVQRRYPEMVYLRSLIDQQLYLYKYSAILQRRPKIVALGSSRVMQFRSQMFGAQAGSFYNAGGMIQNLHDLKSFMDAVPADARPQVIILGLDFWWFNANYSTADREGFSRGIGVDRAYDTQTHLHIIRNLLSNRSRLAMLLANTLKIRSHDSRIGFTLDPNVHTGFRGDGSMLYGTTPPANIATWKYRDLEKPPIPQRIRLGLQKFIPTNGLSNKHLQLLRSILIEAKDRNILVVGFMPPLSSECDILMQSLPNQRSILNQYKKRIPALFKHLDIPLVDASTPSALGLDDRYMRDGVHAMETFHLKLLQVAARNPKVMSALPHVMSTTARMLNSPKTNFWMADLDIPN
jgi:hypothetical protein